MKTALGSSISEAISLRHLPLRSIELDYWLMGAMQLGSVTTACQQVRYHRIAVSDTDLKRPCWLGSGDGAPMYCWCMP